MPTYLALLYDSPAEPANISPEEIQEIIEKYKAWRDKLGASGHLVGGQKLKDGEGRVGRPRRCSWSASIRATRREATF